MPVGEAPGAAARRDLEGSADAVEHDEVVAGALHLGEFESHVDIIMISVIECRRRPMTAKRTATKRKQPADRRLAALPRQGHRLSASRAKTTTRLAKTLGLSETQVVHVALANFARQTLPRYEADNGPLTQQQMDEIAAIAAARRG